MRVLRALTRMTNSKIMNHKIFAVFVNYNFGDKISHAVSSVLKFNSVAGAVVIDNASKDNSIEKVKKIKSKKKLVIIINKKNEGFDKAVNVALKKALTLGADYVIPLDADLDYGKDFIQRLYDVGADYIVPVLKFKRNDQWIYDYGGRVNWLIGRTTHLESNKPLPVQDTAISTSDRSTQNWVDFVSGGCTLMKKEIFEKIGFYDEDYFLYFGDTEFSLRARNAGFKVMVDPTTFMWHTIQEHKVTLNKFKIKVTLQGNLTFINKVIPWYFRPIAYLYFAALISKVLYNLYIHRPNSH